LIGKDAAQRALKRLDVRRLRLENTL